MSQSLGTETKVQIYDQVGQEALLLGKDDVPRTKQSDLRRTLYKTEFRGDLMMIMWSLLMSRY